MSIQLLQDQTYTDSDIVGDDLYVSPDQSNSPFKANMRIVAAYRSMAPADASVRLQMVIEGKTPSGQYFPVGYQFDPFYGFFDQDREIVIDKGAFWPDAGVDNIVFVGGRAIAQISNVQATMPDLWRVRIVAAKDPGATLTGVTISLFTEEYE